MATRRTCTQLVKRRGAFDIGSGSTKFQCSDYSLNNKKILSTIYQEERPILFGADFLTSPVGSISSLIQDAGLQTLYELKKEGDNLGIEEYSGIATEVFRKARNGTAYLQRIRDEIGIKVVILTQDMEAEVGYKSVTSYDSSIDIVWDSGASSFQISTPAPTSGDEEADRIFPEDFAQKSLKVYMDAIGVSVANSIFVENVRNEELRSYSSNINPVLESECAHLIRLLQHRLPPSPLWLRGGVTVGAAAVNNSIFRVCCDVLSGAADTPVTSFTVREAAQALQICLNRSNDDLQRYVSFAYADSPNPIVIKLALLVAVMRHTSIARVNTYPCVGSCPGVISDDRFW